MNMNIWDIVVIVAVAVAVVFAIRRIKNKGVNSCGGSCANCSMREGCNKKNKL